MAKQTFTSGQVLTAAQVNALQANDYNQTVSTKTVSYTLVAADAGTKIVMNSASATTITVNTSLFTAGDTLTILNIGAGVCTVTAGTATVSTTGTLALVQNAGGTLYFTSAGVSVFLGDDVAVTPSVITAQAGATNGTGTTSSASTYTTFATSVAVTVTTGTTALVWISALMSNTNAADACYISFAVSGATTTAATDARAAVQINPANANAIVTQVIPVTGLTAGSNTFTCRHRVSAGTGYFQNPTIVVLATT